jgi:hypothetical protein
VSVKVRAIGYQLSAISQEFEVGSREYEENGKTIVALPGSRSLRNLRNLRNLP